jgi:hypothetical protein
MLNRLTAANITQTPRLTPRIISYAATVTLKGMAETGSRLQSDVRLMLTPDRLLIQLEVYIILCCNAQFLTSALGEV